MIKAAMDYALAPVEPFDVVADRRAARESNSDTEIFGLLESNVRTYCRSFPAVFTKAVGSVLFDEQGKQYIDFLAGAGALNYGHNPGFIRCKLIEYLQDEGIVQGLDLFTVAKREFLEAFQKIILQPRGLDYKVQFYRRELD
jgi:diaminobutyrate-2-oxoglutarate transaminase